VRRAPVALVSRYARALFQAALSRNALDAVHADLAAVSSVWREYPEFVLLAMNPRLSKDKVRGILRGLADRIHAHDLTRHFMNLLVDKDRLGILHDVDEYFERFWRDHAGEVEVTVTSAIPLSDNMRNVVTRHVAEKSGRTPLVNWKEDDGILGGLVIEWPDHIYDGSLIRKLDNLSLRLSQSTTPVTTIS